MDLKRIRIIGEIVSVIGVAATLAANWVTEQTMNETIRLEVAKAVAEANENNDEEEEES